MAINDHPSVRYEQDRSGTWGNAQIKTVKVDFGVRADELVTRVMRIYPSMRINSIVLTVNNAIDGNMDVGYANGELDNAMSAAGTGDADYFYDNVSIDSTGFHESRSTRRHVPLVVNEPGYITVQNKTEIAAADTGTFWMHIEFEYLGNE